MANLLNTLRAWGESLFTAKRSWISAQATYANIERTNITLSTSGEFIAPADGLFGFYVSSNTSTDVYAINGNTPIASRIIFENSGKLEFTACNTIPVNKGSKVVYSFSEIPNEMWFIPTAGSQ